jgi:hypothetical protein
MLFSLTISSPKLNRLSVRSFREGDGAGCSIALAYSQRRVGQVIGNRISAP